MRARPPGKPSGSILVYANAGMPPIQLRVPEEYVPHLKRLVGLPPESMKALLRGLRDSEPSLEMGEFVDSVAAQLSLDRAEARGIVELLTSLSAVREAAGGDVSEFVSAFHGAIEQTGEPDLQPSDWEAFQGAITDMLSGDNPLAVSAKALNVLTDHPRVFLQARVLTDLRPIFRVDVSDPPAALVAIHTLKLEYLAEGAHRSFYITLDSGDVAKLIDVLLRATEKEKSLNALAQDKRLTLLEVKS